MRQPHGVASRHEENGKFAGVRCLRQTLAAYILDSQCAAMGRGYADACSCGQVFALNRPPCVIQSDTATTFGNRLLEGGCPADEAGFALVEERFVGGVAVLMVVPAAQQREGDR